MATGSNNPVAAKKCGSAPMAATSIAKFYNKVAGTSLVNADGTGRGECVSLVSQYLLQVRGLRTNHWGHAIAYKSGGTAGNKLKAAGFKWHTDRDFRDGDILVWGPYKNIVSSYGHVGVRYNGKTMQQNWWDQRYVTLNGFDARGFLGYWRK